jgi:hypothetical protein
MAQLSNNSAPEISPQAVAAVIARARLLMVIAGATTAIALAAVIAVIGFRISAAGGNTMGAIVDGLVTLPRGARVIATGVSAGRIVVTLDVNGTNEMRVFDIKTLKETGRLRFSTEP